VTPPGPGPPQGDPNDPSQYSREGHGEEPGHGPHDEVLKGWLAPEERLWRHPSELSGVARDAGFFLADADHLAFAATRRPWAMGLVGAGAAAAVVVGVVLMNTIGTDGRDTPAGRSLGPTTTTVSLTSSTASAEQSLVTLQITSASGTSLGCGVAVAQGGLIATTADAMAGATAMTATTWSGHREPARLVALDRDSDVALLRIADDVPVPHFVDDVSMASGLQAMVVSVAPSPRSAAVIPMWAPGTVDAVGALVQGGGASGMAGIAANTAALQGQAGALLLETNGSVVGLLDKSGSWDGAPGDEVFLPAPLLLGVSSELATTGKVRHGWLGVSGQDAPSAAGTAIPVGALLVSVNAQGPAASVLRPGDVVQAVGVEPVRSMAELRSRLYVLAPGTPVRLVVLRDHTKMTVEVELSSSP
jgi:putative serine protease PepD